MEDENMKDATILGLAGIAALTAIEIACLLKGIDSAMLAGVVAVIGGLSGYQISQRRK